jgi:hypothetical protein
MRSRETIQVLPLDWRKASFCQNGECVEIAAHNGVVIMRNSTRPESDHIYFTPKEFATFLREAKTGRFDASLATLQN